MARETLLGTSFHNVLGRSAPKRIRQEANTQVVNDDVPDAMNDVPGDLWQPLHGFRVRTSFQYVNEGDTPLRLIVMLGALHIPHLIMSWLMAHDCGLEQTDPEIRNNFFQMPEPAPRTPLSRRQTVLTFVTPIVSPVSIALAKGSKLLDGAGGWGGVGCCDGLWSWPLWRGAPEYVGGLHPLFCPCVVETPDVRHPVLASQI